ncbi:alcohol dehydrogenase [Thioclava sp. SK-1]|uniref:cytochrome c n=1 Tax=Thioclava sp. SK-1 TaxID=1889770 RepID=UPI000826CF96|nr:cytochrome c [Thioclava sp. SK-1]OCX66448.1 alcohol dehydrogenase [Thioclava sp. SK-1]
MANWKWIAGGVVVVAAVAVGGWVWTTVDTSRNAGADDQIALADFVSDDTDAIARGEYVMRSADCAACHTQGQGDFAGGYEIGTPFGTLVSSNITPDRDTGIGAMTERDFFDAVRQGQGSKGMLYPAMPYTAYAKLTDQDMHDLWAYMSTLDPVSNAIDENAGMGFPYNQRIAMLGWNMLFFDNSGFKGDAGGADRGRYLVDAGGHCSSCHTPRNALGAEISDNYLQGARVDGWYAPEITSNPHQGLGQVSVDDIAAYLGTGTDGHAMASGPMADAVEHSLQYLRPDDLTAMAQYMKSVPGSGVTTPAPMDLTATRGALAYEVNCAACHGVSGEGMGLLVPAFADNHAVLSDDATNLARVMLLGARAAHTQAAPTGGGMPSFAWKMDDAQIADVLDYIRNSWGNAARPVDPALVTQMRSSLDARNKITAGE